MLMLQISAAHGPAECQLAVKHALRVMGDEAEHLGVVLTLLEEVPGPHGWLSVVLSLQGDRAASLARAWVGSVQWVCASPLRPGCLRKNWFIGVQALPVAAELPDDDTIVFQTCKASGKGGQHVNKTETAVHARHVASGLSVKVMAERSQLANKRLARALLAGKLAALAQTRQAQGREMAHELHGQVERGSPVRVFRGPRFEP